MDGRPDKPTRTRPAVRARDRESGMVAVWVCLFIVPMLAVFAMALHMGMLMDTRTELQGAADSAALAAVRSLNGETSGLNAARAAAAKYSQAHTALGASVTIDQYGSDLEFGRWHFKAADCTYGTGADCFEPVATTSPRDITSVRIRNGRDGQGQHTAAITLPFGAFAGGKTATMTSMAVAVGGGASETCALPFGLANCKLFDASNQLRCKDGPIRLKFTNNNEDGIAFVGFGGKTPNVPYVASTLRAGCADSEAGEATFQNGNAMNTQITDALVGAPQGNQTYSCFIGEDKIQTFPVLKADCTDGNAQFTGSHEVVGYVQVKILEVTDNKGDPQPCWGKATPTPITPTAAQRSLVIEILCDAPANPDDSVGGTFFNSSGGKIRLVQ
jgi:Flp pilus assembly protein TadG